MHFAHCKKLGLLVACALLPGIARAQAPFQLHSTTFQDDGTPPLSMILNNTVNGVNACTASGAAGLDESPQLSWTGAPRGTRSFVVVLYDTTAAFTHWGMYNIAPSVASLPQNAGVANSTFGPEIMNDFYYGQQYDGPCPPAGYAPEVHIYLFTVYALSTTLNLTSSANFPANAETLYHALIKAGANGQILGHASLVAPYSSTPGTSHTD
ncbi:MAG TPA: YbhB/YbcL family Raf kinase inhibitor-like protein [Terracidiphilus sp.]|nr:YbhB/YbcL family Raf kinase inhibitor-like protein [Terracidiphilus sp.]